MIRRDGPESDARCDRDLVHAARDGDTPSFDALFYRYRDGIYRLAVAITKDPSAGEEIVVDTFARAHRSLARLEPEDTLRPWLYRVAMNLSYDRKPRSGVTFASLEVSPAESFASDERSPAAIAEESEVRRIVLAAIDELGPKHRIVVILHYLNELSLAEIAAVVECPVGTVKSRLFYGVRHLRARLESLPRLGSEPAVFFGAGTGVRIELIAGRGTR